MTTQNKTVSSSSNNTNTVEAKRETTIELPKKEKIVKGSSYESSYIYFDKT